jgi:hypothetical protein
VNLFRDAVPDIPACPKCGHTGDGLQFAFPYYASPAFSKVQAACLACGFHGEIAGSYEEAIHLFAAGKEESDP